MNVRSNNKSSLGALLRASAALEHRMLSEGSSSKLLGSDRSIQESCSCSWCFGFVPKQNDLSTELGA